MGSVLAHLKLVYRVKVEWSLKICCRCERLGRKHGGGEDGFDCTVERVQLWNLEDPMSDGIDQGRAVGHCKRDGSSPR